MTEEKEDYYSLGDVKEHIFSFLSYLKRKWWMLFISFLTGIVLGLVLYYKQKPKYEAVSTFILEEKTSGGGGLAGLASQFGFDIGSFSGGSIFTGDNILDILRSKKIINEVLISKVEANKNSASLADLFLDFSEWKKKWSSKNDLKNINFADAKSLETISSKQDSVLNEIHDFIVKYEFSADRLNKKGSIIRVQVSAPNNDFARLMTERIVNSAAKLYLDIKTGMAQANIEKLQRRSDSLLFLLNQKSYTAASSQPLDINPGIKSAIVPVEIATRDKTVLATLYAEVTKNLEASRLILSQQTPVIQVLDKPAHLLPNTKRSLLFMLLVTPVATVVICTVLVFIMFLVKGRNNQSLKINKASTLQ